MYSHLTLVSLFHKKTQFLIAELNIVQVTYTKLNLQLMLVYVLTLYFKVK